MLSYKNTDSLACASVFFDDIFMYTRHEGVYYGDIKDFSSVMKPILSKLPAPKVANVT